MLVHLEAPVHDALWPRNRQGIVMRTGGSGAGQRDLVALRVGQDSVPRPLLTAPYDEMEPALSPDGPSCEGFVIENLIQVAGDRRSRDRLGAGAG